MHIVSASFKSWLDASNKAAQAIYSVQFKAGGSIKFEKPRDSFGR